jgi:hypothetical protein
VLLQEAEHVFKRFRLRVDEWHAHTIDSRVNLAAEDVGENGSLNFVEQLKFGFDDFAPDIEPHLLWQVQEAFEFDFFRRNLLFDKDVVLS